MMESRYRVVFSGQIQPNIDISDAINNMTSAFNISKEKAQQFLKSNKKRVIKSDLSFETALKYKRQLTAAGLQIEIKNNPPKKINHSESREQRATSTVAKKPNIIPGKDNAKEETQSIMAVNGKAPDSELKVVHGDQEKEFYVVSVRKFTILYFGTFGFYSTYWFYKNWSNYINISGENLWPIPRALFNIFFTHSLFKKIQKALTRKKKSFSWSPSGAATIYVLLTIFSIFLHKLSRKEAGLPYTDLLLLPIMLMVYFCLVKPQKAINFSQNDPKGNCNNSLTLSNYIWIFLGVLYWVSFLYWSLTVLNIIPE